MCNLYNMTPKTDLEVYWRKHVRQGLTVVDYQARTVGPFQSGVFMRPDGNGDILGQPGQWGLIRPGQPERIDYIKPKAVPGKKTPAARPRSTNNARLEGIETKPTFAPAWRSGQRCLIPEPNWETGKNIWWNLKRADGLPWFIAGLWSEWVDPVTGEVAPNFTMLTTNCDSHPVLNRLHKPERDPKTGEVLPLDKQDKRSLVHVDPAGWDKWLHGTEADARELLTPQPLEAFDLTDAYRTDELLRLQPATGSLF
jgi:putative SOS response-associated peptidase YedK